MLSARPMSLANNRPRSTGTTVLTVALVCAVVAPLSPLLGHIDRMGDGSGCTRLLGIEHGPSAHPRMQAQRVQSQAALVHLLARLGADGDGLASRTASRAGGVMARICAHRA